METRTIPEPTTKASDEMPLLGIDHVELYVGNAAQAAYWFTHALGLRHTAYAGLETGVRDRSSYVVEGGRIRFVLTAGLHGGSELGRHVAEHGDGVKVVALSVPDAEQSYRVAVRRGARGLREPHEVSDEHGIVRLATIGTYGETVHTFVERNGYRGAFMPGYELTNGGAADAGLLAGVDHVVGNVELG
ncbi:MAG: VOC family protein, partial [Gammaproteobacteria bacterium]